MRLILALLILVFPNIADAKIPVVFVHGLFGSSYAWDTFIPYLEDNGWDSSEILAIDVETDNYVLCSEEHWPYVIDGINTLSAANGNSQVAVIGHSRGLNNILAVMHQAGYATTAAKVDIVVGLAGAANACPDLFTRQEDSTPGDASYHSLCSPDDANAGCYWPYIEGADNRSYDGITHSEFRSDPLILSEVLGILNEWDIAFGTPEPVAFRRLRSIMLSNGSWIYNLKHRSLQE